MQIPQGRGVVFVVRFGDQRCTLTEVTKYATVEAAFVRLKIEEPEAPYPLGQWDNLFRLASGVGRITRADKIKSLSVPQQGSVIVPQHESVINDHGHRGVAGVDAIAGLPIFRDGRDGALRIIEAGVWAKDIFACTEAGIEQRCANHKGGRQAQSRALRPDHLTQLSRGQDQRQWR